MKDFNLDKIAELAMLRLDESEKAPLRQDMEEIVSFAENIAMADIPEQKLKISSAELREDRAEISLNTADVLAAAETEDGFFFVPRVVE